MGEFERIARLTQRFLLATSRTRVLVDIGDDSAVVDVGAPVVVSTDASVEGVHFRREFGSLDALAARAVHAAASDLAAMGADPCSILLSVGMPSSTSDEDFDRLVEGFARASAELSMPIVGGNLSRASELGIHTTVLGRQVGPPLLRSGAKVGDAVFVTGPLGGAALGLSALLAGRARAEDPAVSTWLAPRARFDASARVRDVATACIDVSDGLSADLGHVLSASAVGATLERALVPVPPWFEVRRVDDGASWESLVLEGGEDYELVFTAPEGTVDPGVATRIGRIDSEPGLRLRDEGGTRAIVPRGHVHR